ncbi:TIGR02391 family protein [Plectonema radiosum NIES-515]|uniref:TIGR02391 family protein n=1 Tax=Plectonema radiosum NIES-515 TaxID=2986073 RepID=A0ABT3ATT2_9CYAN|nr:TIGR02391 family protein [Plectonema radiosum]MCV3212523.1 TIGR02391 family protein [Plectonema radiosum NIES-515]
MNLEPIISPFLYQIVKPKYECGLYRDAILAATFKLEEWIKLKADLDTSQITANFDCINEVFGMPKPLVKVNSMNTVGEVYEQIGFEKILEGIWQGIRNSRIHTECLDDETTAYAIIVFIDYLINRIQNSVNIQYERS